MENQEDITLGKPITLVKNVASKLFFKIKYEWIKYGGEKWMDKYKITKGEKNHPYSLLIIEHL